MVIIFPVQISLPQYVQSQVSSRIGEHEQLCLELLLITKLVSIVVAAALKP